MSPIYSHERREREWRAYRNARRAFPWRDLLHVLSWVAFFAALSIVIISY